MRFNFKKVLVLVLPIFILLGSIAYSGGSIQRLLTGNTYYVSASGNDANPCSVFSPCRTYGRAESLAVAGDTIYFVTNAYPAFVITKPVSVVGNGSLINATLTPNGITISSDGVSLKGFEVVNSTSFGIYVNKKNFVIENNTVRNTVTSNNATATTCKNPSSGWGSAIKVRVGGGNGIIRNNTVYKNCGEGIAVTRGFNVVVENNRTYDNYSVNIYVDNSYDIVVRNNVSYCTGIYLRNGNRANAYALGEEEYSGWGTKLENILVDRNSGKDCRRGIIALESYQSSSIYSNITISNNDFSTGQTRSISLDSTHNSNVLVQNNIIFGSIWVRSPVGVTLRNNVLLGTPTWTLSSGFTPTASRTSIPPVTATQTVISKSTSTVTKTSTPALTRVTSTNTPSPTSTSTKTVTPSSTVSPTSTVASITPVSNLPYPSAPLCPPSHDPTKWHNLWDSVRRCHYDHEHGQTPFTADVTRTFAPLGDLQTLLGGVQIGHTNPSSPMELTHKHGGFKWQVSVSAPQGCITGFEDGTIAVKAYAIQFHAFGRQDVEHEARNHSSAGMLQFCKSDNPNDVGYMFFIQLQEYGERVMPYQGMVLPYPDNFLPQWDGRRGQYFTTECVGADFNVVDAIRGILFIDCRDVGDIRSNNLTIWTSKITGIGARPPGSNTFTMLFRGRDNYQRLDASDLVYPFMWKWVCGGNTFVPVGCRFNSSTFTIHEVMGNIPATWDGASFDTDPRAERVSFVGFVDRFGAKLTDLECQVAGGNCYPIKLVSAFVGKYSSEISVNKVSNPTPLDTPERDIYFCGLIVCTETSPNAIPSGWIGSEN